MTSLLFMIIPPLSCRFAVGNAGLTAPMNVVPQPDPSVNNRQQSRARLAMLQRLSGEPPARRHGFSNGRKPGSTVMGAAGSHRGVLSCFFQGFSTVLLRSM